MEQESDRMHFLRLVFLRSVDMNIEPARPSKETGRQSQNWVPGTTKCSKVVSSRHSGSS